ncbi:CACTA en-spm transposon protein [Cucumis melo var. makuwa]|uniref:CACTA en-spm transposon protein n=1 Tax=Cucumis melo var. makuwa TaxID=1194695 RepID=A0A5A7TL37_CUCMM|nr:CACTA en-spm transposon protein [Cucumis melo var. makuwa]
MLNTFKEFQGNCYKHFKKYSDPEEACANPPHLLVGRDKDRHFLYDRYMSCAFQRRAGRPCGVVPKTHIQDGTFVSQAAEDAHHQMLEFKSQPTLAGSQPLSRDDTWKTVLGR